MQMLAAFLLALVHVFDKVRVRVWVRVRFGVRVRVGVKVRVTP